MPSSRITAATRRSARQLHLLRPSALTLAIGSLAFNLAQAQESTPTVPTSPSSPLEQVIVTGTRAVGTKETASITPISVISADTLKKTGQNSVIDALIRLEPSFQAPARGGDVASIVRSATLRSLTANETLVLVNGKRRNTTAYISPGSGASAVDLDLIPLSAVERVEVLKEGAAAQYGSDAIGGVLNIILKSGTDGTIQIDAGRFANSKVTDNNLGNGLTKSIAADKGFKLGENGFIHFGGEFRSHDHTNQTGPELRRSPQNNAVTKQGTLTTQGPYPFSADAPAVNGDASYDLASGSYNAGFKLNPDLEIYSFGTYSRRNAASNQNVRPLEFYSASNCFVAPDGSGRVIHTYPLGGAPAATCSTYTLNSTNASTVSGAQSLINVAKSYYPGNYFIPVETLREKNLALALGIKGTVWNDARWDLSLGYGKDKMDIGVENSLNYAYLLNSSDPLGPHGQSQTSAYIGQYNNSQTIGNLDVSKPFEIGLPEPLEVSLGIESRRDTYGVKQGDTQSWANGGLQGFVGETPTDAGDHSRREQAAYFELDTNLTAKWVASLAGRYEHYSDSGQTKTGKLSTRYDFNSMFGVRGTYSTGFRAPTLSEQNFTTTTVGPTSASVVLPPGSPAAALVGGGQLKPEKSKDLSLGAVLTPTKTTRFTLDAYKITIDNRLISFSNSETQSPYGNPAATNDPTLAPSTLVGQAITLRGVVVPATAAPANTSIQYFTNGVDVTVKGVDLTASTQTDLPTGFGAIRWTLAGNFNQASLRRYPRSFSEAQVEAAKNAGYPKDKFVLQADYLIEKWTLTSRLSHYGPVSSLSVPSGTTFDGNRTLPSGAVNPNFNPWIRTKTSAAFILDGELGYQVLPELRLVLGGNNLTNRRPQRPPDLLVTGYPSGTSPSGALASRTNSATGAGVVPTQSPYGINGAYYYARAIYNF